MQDLSRYVELPISGDMRLTGTLRTPKQDRCKRNFVNAIRAGAATFSHTRFADGSRADKGSDGIDANLIIALL
jgi:hypothetical protein